ncbi:putative membrane protein YesL [Evansella vedderi]|uniref:Membrane protein YesL n=1 Tax=Evansella vedderi TaxID=38282 RepID=A0ABU0A0X2_9BACI|nr:YesL family protein [Evansella vedderi]MDQ0256779.1 putative membrane protein YesL [Evansella vedderi]
MNGNAWAGIMGIFEWVMRLAYVNVLWILFTIVGLFVFGFFPATAAMFAVIRKWIKGESEIPVFKTFWEYYRKEFFKINLIGLFILIIGVIIYVDFLFLATVDGWLATILTSLLIFGSVLFVIILFYIFPLFVHYQFTLFQYFKFAIFIGITKPITTIGIAICTIILYYALLIFPGMSLFYSGSLLAFAIMWLTHNVIQKIEAQGD